MKLYKEFLLFSLLYLGTIGIAVSQDGDFFGIPLTTGDARGKGKNNGLPQVVKDGKNDLNFKTIFPQEVWQLSGGKERKGPLQYYWVDGNQGNGKIRIVFEDSSRLKDGVKECVLVLHVAKTRNSGSPGWIRVRMQRAGEEIGLKHGAPKGREVRIPLKTPKRERLAPLVIEVMTGSNNGMRFIGEGENAPYLQVR